MDFYTSIPAFSGVYKSNIDSLAKKTPYFYYCNMFPEEALTVIVRETTRYGIVMGILTSVSGNEINCFLAINIIMTYVKYPNYRMYWSSNQALRMSLIADITPLMKFEKIERYLQFEDNDTIPKSNTDIFVKVKPILEILKETFSGTVTPTEYQAIDEMIILFKGGSRAKQYIKSKPKKWGFKAWVRSSSDGFVIFF